MKLLILTNNPDRASFRQRIGVYCDILHRNGIQCEVAKLPSGSMARRRLFKRASDFDGVFLHKKKLNFLDAFWLRQYSRKLIYNFDDAIMYSDRTPERDSRSHFKPWRRSVRLADMVIAGSTYLAEHARRFNSNVQVLPIGLKVSQYDVDNPARVDDKIRLVWIGSSSTLRYLEGIRPALEEIGLRFDNVVLRIICDVFFDLENMPVEKRKWSADTRGVDLATSDIGLAPLPDNRFTRGKCTFKVLEYSAAGLPIVASPVGTNSEHVRQNVTGFFAQEADEWIDKLCRLLEDPILRQRMGKAAMQLAHEYDVDVVGKKLTALISRCLTNDGPNHVGDRLRQLRRAVKRRLSFAKRRYVQPPYPKNAEGKTLVHIGCGKINSAEFINVDAQPYAHVHIVTSNISRLPDFADGTVDLVYMCHVLEHVKRNNLNKVLLEMKRILKDGGVLRLSVPDFDRLAEVYHHSGKDITAITNQLMGGQDSDYNIHYSVFNHRHLTELLKRTGFQTIRLWDPWNCQYHNFKDKACKVMRAGGQDFPISLNLEAVK